MIDIFVGYDPREASAYHAFCDSVIRRTSRPVRFTPLYPNLAEVGQGEGSNSFNRSRFLVPYLRDYRGMALYVDGDMICLTDIIEILDEFDPAFAVQVVKHDYKTRAPRKYLGNKNEDYPRKNWSSVMLFNCERCRALTPAVVREASGQYLHRFEWCEDGDIGELPAEWNHLVGEYPPCGDAKILHYTLGTPCFPDYYRSDYADEWRREFAEACRPVPQVRA